MCLFSHASQQFLKINANLLLFFPIYTCIFVLGYEGIYFFRARLLSQSKTASPLGTMLEDTRETTDGEFMGMPLGNLSTF